MEQRWLRHYRPFAERVPSVHDKARTILSLLAASSVRLTTKQIGSQTGFLETKSRSYLGLLEAEGLVDKVTGAAGPHRCKRRVCGCLGWGITDVGREYLSQASN